MQPELQPFNHDILTHNPEEALGGLWPGIQLYFPPIKFIPEKSRYESVKEAFERIKRHALTNPDIHTLLFDLEDGCQQKALSRELLNEALPLFIEANVQVAIRINPFRTDEYLKDLELIRSQSQFIDVVMLAKAGELYGASEIRDLSAWLAGVNPAISIQPIIEHPRSLKISPELLAFPSVRHVVFGIHDFSKAMAFNLTPENWIYELRPFLTTLLLEARVSGKGVIGGVEVLLMDKPTPREIVEPRDVRRWLDLHGDREAKFVYEHALEETNMGLTGKQVIHPYHAHLCKLAFTPSPETIRKKIEILQLAISANALLGGAIRFEGEMLDPPMFGKALQVLLRAKSLGSLNKQDTNFALEVLNLLPVQVIRENWPYGNF